MKSLRDLYAGHVGKGSDKWSHYLDAYDHSFSGLRCKRIHLFEIGIQNGGSLDIWAKYFSEAVSIIGCDIDAACAGLIYDDPRIHVLIGDASSSRIVQQVSSITNTLDIVIDDGSHTSSDIIKGFFQYFPMLSDGGIYAVEDLHCSYWRSFEGGLYFPYSSLGFFKRLSDIVNHEHWGVKRSRISLLDNIIANYRIDLDRDQIEGCLSQIHSLEFSNSLCIIRKRLSAENALGPRIIAGDLASVVEGQSRLQGTLLAAPTQEMNPWTSLDALPEDASSAERAALDFEASLARALDESEARRIELAQRARTVDTLRATLSRHEQELVDSRQRESSLSEQIALLQTLAIEQEALVTALRNSTSWRLTSPMRTTATTLYMARRRLGGIRRLIMRDGPGAVAGKAWRLYQRGGLRGLRRHVGEALTYYGGESAAAPGARPRMQQLDRYLPVAVQDPGPLPRAGVDVIIPVYRGLEETRKCIESVLSAIVETDIRVVVINDCSPEPELSAYLRNLPVEPRLVVLDNEQNLGFVGTVNRGMRMSRDRDVVLLNSDTEVAAGWLDRLVRHAYSGEHVGSVTPFSNNATICSYPRIEGLRQMPGQESLEFLNKAFWEANAGRSILLPTAIGFCMYIRRTCLDEVGMFDEEAFGKGYGEENDFCLRAIAAGWHHLLAADTFVYHAGEVSFQSDSSPGKERASQIIRDRYPTYEADVARHIEAREAEPLRIAATAARYRLSEKPVVLLVTHAFGGGTQKYVGEQCRQLADVAHCLILQPKKGNADVVELKSADGVDLAGFELLLTENVDFLAKLLKSFGVSKAHIHHTAGFSDALSSLIARLEIPFQTTVHDYFAICPQINLTVDGRYCGEPDASGCNACIRTKPSFDAADITWWRQKNAWTLNGAEIVFCPSQDVARRLHHYHPGANIIVRSHELAEWLPPEAPSLAAGEPLRVVLLGWLVAHKGAGLVLDCIEQAHAERRQDIHFHLIGRATDDFVPSSLFSETGEYIDSELDALIQQADPHVIWLPSIAPETYSYTLSATLKARRPVVVSSLGALPERIAGRHWSWVLPWNASADEALAFFDRVRIDFEAGHPSSQPISSPKSMFPTAYGTEHHLDFVARSKEPGPIDLRHGNRVSILLVPEMLGDVPSPCAYIRLLLPLISAANKIIDIRVITAADVDHYIADVLYTHRIAIQDAMVNRVIDHCAQTGMRLIYDLDDDLIAVANSAHPERAFYAARAEGISRLIEAADEVRASTPVLVERLKNKSSKIKLVPNALDGDTWALHQPLEKARTDTVSLLYMGTLTHQADLDLVQGALRRLKYTFGDAIDINVVGVSQERGDFPWCNFLDIPDHAHRSYPAFVDWLRRAGPFDIGIAPLVDTKFNEAKSGIKFLDYAALGLATACSDVPAYRDVVENGVTGLLVGPDEDDWYAALSLLVTDPARRREIAAAARSRLIERHALQSVEGSAPFSLN